MSCSSFYDLICKVQGPVEVDMFGENLEVVGLGGRIRHILKLQARWVVSEEAGAICPELCGHGSLGHAL